jgi:hypothetical protein
MTACLLLFTELIEDFDYLMNQLVIVGFIPDGVRNTAFQMIFKDHHADRVDGPTGGGNLLQDVEAIAVFLYHPADTPYLSLNTIDPRKQRLVIVSTERHRTPPYMLILSMSILES